jgi:chloramphenicol-sensitive protein RarD
MQFLLGLIVYNEPLDPMRLASFVIIWAGLAVFAHDAVRTARAAREGA